MLMHRLYNVEILLGSLSVPETGDPEGEQIVGGHAVG